MAKKKAAKKKRRSRRVVKRRVSRSRRVAKRKSTRVSRKSSRTSSVSYHKKKIRESGNTMLKDALYQRDKATNRKQHITAQLKVDKARKLLRSV
jgi:hypothetical protein